MSILNKTISISLLISIIILYYPMGMASSCQADKSMQKMACCSYSHVLVGKNITSQPCVCSISSNQNTEIPTTNSAIILKPNTKENDINFESDSYPNTCSIEVPAISSKFETTFQQSLSSDLKIYNLISSYLI